MPKGGKVTVGTSVLVDPDRIDAHGLPPGTYVVICIIDQGEGMPPEVLRRATEPFFTTKGPGTGLGLAMVHGFVQQSHGRLEIDSSPGKGTTVRMIFPIADRAAGDIAAERLGSAHPGNESAWSVESLMDRKTIMVVDDSDDIRELTKTYLQSQGYHVISAASGEDALVLLNRHGDIDLLFTDIIMPGGMNGLQLIEQVRALQPEVPVLVTTGYMEDLTTATETGRPLDILGKPFKLAELAARVRQALDERTLQPSVAEFRHEG
jgi:CheY-like chemotaxis protein